MKRFFLMALVCFFAVSCGLTDGFGEGEENEDPDLVVSRVTINSVDDISAIVDFDVSGGNSIVSSILYSTTPDPKLPDCSSMPLMSHQEFTELGNLMPETTYYIRGYAVNDNDRGFYGETTQFTTKKPHPRVENVFVWEVQERSVKVSYIARGPRIKSVGICCSTDEHPTVASEYKAEGVFVTEEEGIETVLDGLPERTHFFLRAYVITTDDEVFYSQEEPDFTSGTAYQPNMSIVNYTLGDIFATIEYTVNESSFTQRGLCYATHAEPTIADFKTEEEPVTGTEKVKLLDLQPETTYYIRPYIVMPNEKIYYGELHEFTTYPIEEYLIFPDARFESYLVRKEDKNGDGKISRREAAQIYYIDVKSYGITSLEGIEYFTALKVLICQENKIAKLDLTANTALTTVECSSNALQELTLGNSAELEYLACSSNLLTTLDVSNFKKLRTLHCSDNKLLSLDVRANTLLEDLGCGTNFMTALDLSNNPLLEDLHCATAKLTSLDLSRNPKLKWVKCYANELTSLNLTGCSELLTIDCDNNKLTQLNVSAATKLEKFWCGRNQIQHLDLSRIKRLTEFDSDGSKLLNLDLSGNTQLTLVRCGNNLELQTLNVSGCTALKELYCYVGKLTTLDVSGLKALATLSCANNKLTSINLKGATLLSLLSCSENLLTTLDVTENIYLETLYCENNKITELDLRKNPYIKSLLHDYGVHVIRN